MAASVRLGRCGGPPLAYRKTPLIASLSYFNNVFHLSPLFERGLSFIRSPREENPEPVDAVADAFDSIRRNGRRRRRRRRRRRVECDPGEEKSCSPEEDCESEGHKKAEKATLRPKKTVESEEKKTVESEEKKTVEHEEKKTVEHEEKKTVEHEEKKTVESEEKKTVESEEKKTVEHEESKAEDVLDAWIKEWLDSMEDRDLRTKMEGKMDRLRDRIIPGWQLFGPEVICIQVLLSLFAIEEQVWPHICTTVFRAAADESKSEAARGSVRSSDETMAFWRALFDGARLYVEDPSYFERLSVAVKRTVLAVLNARLDAPQLKGSRQWWKLMKRYRKLKSSFSNQFGIPELYNFNFFNGVEWYFRYQSLKDRAAKLPPTEASDDEALALASRYFCYAPHESTLPDPRLYNIRKPRSEDLIQEWRLCKVPATEDPNIIIQAARRIFATHLRLQAANMSQNLAKWVREECFQRNQLIIDALNMHDIPVNLISKRSWKRSLNDVYGNLTKSFFQRPARRCVKIAVNAILNELFPLLTLKETQRALNSPSITPQTKSQPSQSAIFSSLSSIRSHLSTID